MENFKFNINKKTVEVSKDMFNLTVDSSAYADKIVTDFYRTAMITPSDAELFHNVPGNKNTKRIPMTAVGRVTKPFNCGWADGNSATLSAKEVKVAKVSIMEEICVEDIEDSFLVWDLAKGSNKGITPQSIVSFVFDDLARAARRDLEYLRWYGDTSTPDSIDNFTDITDGYMTLIEANATDIVDLSASYVPVTRANVLDQLNTALDNIPQELRGHYGDLVVYVSSNVHLAYASVQTGGVATSDHLELVSKFLYLGKYKIVEVPQLNDDIILIAPKQDMVYTYDVQDEGFTVVDRNHSAAVPTLRFRMNLYYGFDIVEYGNIVYLGAPF